MLVYLDACAIIDAREKETAEAQAVIDLIAECAGEETPFITSELTLLEALVHPIRGLVDKGPLGGDPQSRDFHDWYDANLVADGALFKTKAISRDILRQAALMRARVPSLRTPDAIHAATAYRCGCTHFVTRDPRLVSGIERDDEWTRSPKRFAFVPLSVEALVSLRTTLLS